MSAAGELLGWSAGCTPPTAARLLTVLCSLAPNPAVNAGHFVLLPTNASLAFAEAWAGAGPASVPQKVTEQKALAGLAGSHFVACRSLCLCYRRKFEVRGGALVVERGCCCNLRGQSVDMG